MKRRASRGIAGASLAAITGVALVAAPGPAETFTIALNAEVLVPPLQRLEVAPGMLAWPVPTANDLAAGYLDADEPMTLTVFSNTAWDLALRVVQPEPAATGGGPVPGTRAVPILWRTESGDFAPLSDAWVVVASGAIADGETVRIDLRIPLDAAGARPGEYAPRLEYRLAPAGR